MREGGSLSTRAFSRRTRWREMREGRRGSWQRASMPSYFGSLLKEQAPTKYLSEGEAEVRAGEGGAGVGVGAGRTGPEAEAAAVEVGVEVGGAGRGAGAGGRGAGALIPQLRGSRKSFKRIDPTGDGQRNMTYLFQRQYWIFVKRRSAEYAGL